jgi:hypothetical protein
MNDEENKRQRHLAEMLIAECDGKQVQRKNIATDGWYNFCLQRFFEDEHKVGNLRIKPEPREWWLCEVCNQRFVCNPIKHSQQRSIAQCNGTPFLIREVLHD